MSSTKFNSIVAELHHLILNNGPAFGSVSAQQTALAQLEDVTASKDMAKLKEFRTDIIKQVRVADQHQRQTAKANNRIEKRRGGDKAKATCQKIAGRNSASILADLEHYSEEEDEDYYDDEHRV